jgi:hypothetical protein
MLIREGLLALDDLLQVSLHQLRDQIHVHLRLKLGNSNEGVPFFTAKRVCQKEIVIFP